MEQLVGLIGYLLAGFGSVAAALIMRDFLRLRNGQEDTLITYALPIVAGIVVGAAMLFFWWVVLPVVLIAYGVFFIWHRLKHG